MNMLQIFQIGDEIQGHCNGYFGRDDNSNKMCVMVTSKYAVFQYENGHATVLNYTERLGRQAESVKRLVKGNI